jgi:hypothetical protein
MANRNTKLRRKEASKLLRASGKKGTPGISQRESRWHGNESISVRNNAAAKRRS